MLHTAVKTVNIEIDRVSRDVGGGRWDSKTNALCTPPSIFLSLYLRAGSHAVHLLHLIPLLSSQIYREFSVTAIHKIVPHTSQSLFAFSSYQTFLISQPSQPAVM